MAAIPRETGDGGFLWGIPGPFTVIPGLPYRHSRVSGNPTVACRQYHHKAVPSGFPLTRE